MEHNGSIIISSIIFFTSLPTSMSFRAYVLRHGQTNYNANEIEQGSSDFSRLTELGQKQATDAYQALFDNTSSTPPGGDKHAKNTIVERTITSIYTSPLTRARQTLEQLRSADAKRASSGSSDVILPPSDMILNNLREIDQYDWEGQRYGELRDQFPTSWLAWEKGLPNDMMVYETTSPDAEPIEHYPLLEMWDRADKVWNEILGHEKQKLDDDVTEDRTALIVAHGNLGQGLLGTALGKDASSFNNPESIFGNCGMCEIEFSDLSIYPRKTAKRWRWRWPVPSSEWNELS